MTPPYEFVAARGAVALATRSSRDGGSERFVDRMELFDSVVSGLTELVDRVRPVGRRLAPTEEEDLCRYCYLMALYDEGYRMGLAGEVSVQVAGGAGGIHGSPLKSGTRASMAGMPCLRVVDR